ncbi:helix-turn-helix transcriptional regulator [Desertimonas flava]|uniref:helix-turn-helix transcriptional regulator n=1 Tax=Desertimonas flava TaxID=2064846 RepID=UPI000E351CCA|nr:helix-turn-helix transcriptional regulator [Desertimonas flava]
MASELGDFLRSHRERLSPEDFGFRGGGRRRTPGLRREEVATLAGISIEYLIRLEQGRDTSPSQPVLHSLAAALRLDDAERKHLVMLAMREQDSGVCRAGARPIETVAPSVTLLLQRLGPSPAVVLGPYGDLLAWNGTWTRLLAPVGLLDGPRPNLVRFVFTHPSARTLYADWDAVADAHAAQLRAAAASWHLDQRVHDLVAELSAEPEFARRWSAHQVGDEKRGATRLQHPTLGPLAVRFEILLLADHFDQRLLVWLPDDAPTDAAFTGLAGNDTDGPAASVTRLRVV